MHCLNWLALFRCGEAFERSLIDKIKIFSLKLELMSGSFLKRGYLVGETPLEFYSV